MATNSRIKIGEIGRLTFIRRLGVPKRSIEYRNSHFKRFTCDDMATLFKNLVNFGPVTPEFKRVRCTVHPSSISSLPTFAWGRHC